MLRSLALMASSNAKWLDHREDIDFDLGVDIAGPHISTVRT